LAPQQLTAPLARSAHVWLKPAAIDTALVKFTTVAALDSKIGGVPTASPVPSLLKLFAPQQRAVPSNRTAHVWSTPAAIATTPRSVEPLGLTTGTGVNRGVVVVPSPSRPRSLEPQHTMEPVARRAHECSAPAATATASVRPDTVTGDAEN
jgi:hypothetical protein